MTQLVAPTMTHPPTVRTPRTARSRRSRESLVEVRLRPPTSAHWIGQLSERFPAQVRLLLCRPTGPADSRMLRVVEVTGNPNDMPAIARYVKASGVRGTTTVAPRGSHRMLVWAEEPMPANCAAVFHIGAVCTACPLTPTTTPDGTSERAWNLLLPRVSPRARSLLKVFGPTEGAGAVLRVGGSEPKGEMTSRQEKAVETAFQMGYFEHPRRVELRDVAAALGVSRSTALELLRRGLTKVLSQRHARGPPGLALE